MPKERSKKQARLLTPREAARDFIRPYILMGDTFSLRSSSRECIVKKHYSAYMQDGNIVVVMFHGKAVQEEYPLRDILDDLGEEQSGKPLPSLQPLAKTRYVEKEKEIHALLVRLKEKLKRHKQEFSKNTKNWGYAGELEHILGLLKEITGFLPY